MVQYFPGHTNRLRAVIKHESGKISFKTGTIEVDAWHESLYSTTKVQLCRREPLWITAQIRYKSVIFQQIFTIDTYCQWGLTVYCMTQWYRRWTVWLIVHLMRKGALANRYVVRRRNMATERELYNNGPKLSLDIGAESRKIVNVLNWIIEYQYIYIYMYTHISLWVLTI